MNRTNRVLTDLNLLRVFLTIWDVRSLTVAGQRLGLTQSAVSHSLRRLREAFEDPLFVRTTDSMAPTEAATRLHPPISEALQIIQRAVQDHERFDPSTAQRVFKVAMSDVSELYLLPSLMTWVAQAAPLVRIEIVPLAPSTVEQAMRAGEVDLTVGFVPNLDRDVVSHRLFTDSFICLVRAEHPIMQTALTKASIAQLGFVYASSNAPGHHFTEQWLTEIGVKRQIVVKLGHFSVAPNVVRETDLAVIFPESVARLINHDNDFIILPLPAGQPTIDIMVHTHSRFQSDLGIRWLRDSLIMRCSGPLRPGRRSDKAMLPEQRDYA